MTKKELVKIIAKKAAVIDASAKELFDLFLRRLPEDLQPGESAQFSNVGHFHFRKGRVVTEETGSKESKVEYLDLIIFSPSAALDIKSAGNLVFSVPDLPSSKENDLDAHFSLSVGKPVLPSLEGSSSAVYSTDELQEILNRKVEGLMVNLRKDESSIEDRDVLSVDVKQIDQDQYELELDEQAKIKNTKTAEDSIHSSEELKSMAWSFGKDLSNQIGSNGLPLDQAEQTKTEESVSDRDKGETGSIGTNKDVNNSSTDSIESSERLDDPISFPSKANDIVLKLPGNAVDEFDLFDLKSDERDKKIDLTEITSDEVRDGADKLTEESIDADSLAKSLMDEIDKTDLDIDMDDFDVSDNNEKLGKFERVRSISSSYNDIKSIKDIEGFESFIKDKVDVRNSPDSNGKSEGFSEAEDSDPSDFSEQKDTTEDSTQSKHKPKKLFLGKTGSQQNHDFGRKNSAVKFLIIIAIMIGAVGIVYLLTSNGKNSDINTEIVIPTAISSNTTYIERTYDLPVNYPYTKPENEIEITGLEPPDNNFANTNETNLVETKKPVENPNRKPVTNSNNSGIRPTGTPVQVAYSIYQYGNYYAVQVAAFRLESAANQEVSRFNSLGYNAFVENVTIDGVMWHRVRVGNFDSIDKAKQFRTSQQ